MTGGIAKGNEIADQLSSRFRKADIDAYVAKLGWRYAILDSVESGGTLFVKKNMDDIAGGEYIGLAPRECAHIKVAQFCARSHNGIIEGQGPCGPRPSCSEVSVAAPTCSGANVV